MSKLITLIFFICAFAVYAEAPKLLEFELSTNNPVVGGNAVVFVNPTTLYESPSEVQLYLKPSLKLNSSSTNEPYAFFKSGDGQWVFYGGPFSQSGTYALKIQVYIEDYRANDIRSDLSHLDIRIMELTEQIAVEQNPVRKQELIDEKNLNIQMKNNLKDVLVELQTYIGYEQFDFEVSEI